MNFDDSASSGYATAETIYGTHEDSHVVMSEKVQSLAGSIYQEFEKMIARYDEDVVKTLMPLLVNVLECLDSAYQTNQEHEVELELLREDNEQLVTQYEREKSARKHSEQKLLEAEDHYEGERKDLTGRLEALDSIVRMLELKYKNSLDHASRLEERENELKKEYAKLHERYTELFKTHMDYMERTKLLLSTAGERGEARGRLVLGGAGAGGAARSSGPVSFGFASLEAGERDSLGGSAGSLSPSPPSPPSPAARSPALGAELAAARTVERAHQTDPITQHSQATSPVTPTAGAPTGRSQTKSEKRSGNTLYQELAFHDTDAGLADGDDGADITGSWVHPGEYASSVNDNYFGMGKEVENLILENNELLATKNALNVVKDDLIVKVDELTGEQEILREEVSALSAARERLRARVASLEEEVRALREAVREPGRGSGAGDDDEADVPMAQRRKFTRVEMARVLMERNQYKERFMELQDAVRWTEMMRATRMQDTAIDKKSKQSIWKFFSNLFSSSERPQRPVSTPHMRAVAAAQPALRHSRTQADFLETQLSDHHPHAHTHAHARRPEHAPTRTDQFRQVRAHVRKEDGRTQAYGWSLPCRTAAAAATTSGGGGGGGGGGGASHRGGVPVPVPVFCRPIAESEPQMSLLCAAAVDCGTHPSDVSLAYEMSAAQTPDAETEPAPAPGTKAGTGAGAASSLVWICASTKNKGVVMIIDANNPAEVIESFPVSDKHILCVASVPAACRDDYREHELAAAAPALAPAAARPDAALAPTDTAAAPAPAPADAEDGNKRHSQSLFCVGKSESTESQPNGPVSHVNVAEEEGGVVVGTTRYVQATLLTPPSTPVKETPPTATTAAAAEGAQGDGGDADADSALAESPPLSSTPVNVPVAVGRNSPETGVDAFAQEQSEAAVAGAGAGDAAEEGTRDAPTVMATMWLGTKSGNLYVHSAVDNYSKCLARVKLNDAILSIVWCASRCVVALADGTIAVFARRADGRWDLAHYWLVALGEPKWSVRCLSAVGGGAGGGAVWCGYRNRVLVVEPRTRRVLHALEAHPRRESQVRQLAAHRDGVWVSIKMDSALRLYSAHTYCHLKDVDIEPYVSKMLGTGKLGFSLVRITALLISSGRLWIGTSNGVVISVPLSDADDGAAVPLCSMAHAQLSFHGHREAVTFFVAVPGAAPPRSPDSPAPAPATAAPAGTPSPPASAACSPAESPSHAAVPASAPAPAASLEPSSTPLPPMLVISGGEGYIDFRIADSELEESATAAEDGASSGHSSLAERAARSHLIVWQVAPA